MSTDVVFVLETAASIATAAVALLAAYRSFTIGKSLVSRVYRTRAYWLVVLMIIFATFAVYPSSSVTVSNILFLTFLFALLVFIDSNVSVAREIDFFHKDTLHWHSARIPMFSAVVASSAIVGVLLTTSANSNILGIVLVGYFVLLGAVFAYSGAALFVIARRTYDRTMKRFVRMLAFAILCYVLFLTLFIPLDAIYPSLGDVVTAFIAIGAAYFFYLAAMSLSDVGRIVKEVIK